MQRVRSAAKKIGAETFEGKGIEANRAWIRSKVKEGYEVHDIGPDFARRANRAEQGARPDSPFYNMERTAIQDIKNNLREQGGMRVALLELIGESYGYSTIKILFREII